MNALHRHTLESIPWLVNGRLADDERRTLEEHLGECSECRKELVAQRRLHAAIAREPRVEYAPGASLQKLWTRIGNIDGDIPSSATPNRSTRHRAMQWLIAAVVVEAIGITLLATLPRASTTAINTSPPAYRTVTTTEIVPQNAALRVVFAPHMALNELNALLREQQLEIVNGPSPAGVYTLATTAPAAQLPNTLAKLRAHNGVQFAEPIVVEPRPQQ